MPRDSWRDTYRSLANKLYKRKSRSELQEKLSQTNQFLNHVTSGSLRNIPNSVIESAKRDRLSLRRRIGLATNERQRSTAYKRAANQASGGTFQLIVDEQSTVSPKVHPPKVSQPELPNDDLCDDDTIVTPQELDEVDDANDTDLYDEIYAQLPEVDNSVFPMRKFTTSEIWAILLALKIRFKLSDACLLGLCQAINSLALGTPRNLLPSNFRALSAALVKASALKRTWVVYCSKCQEIIGEMESRPKEASCTPCKFNLTKELESGNCTFATLSIRAQLASYMKVGLLPRLMKSFKKVDWGRLKGGSHDVIFRDDDLDLTMACDAAQITKSTRLQIYPVFFFLNNIPNNYQLKFPVLAALYSGPSDTKPHASIFMKKAMMELEDLQKNPLTYKFQGKIVQQKVFVTISSADQPQRHEMLNQNSGYFGCPYCYIEGSWYSNSVRYQQLVHLHHTTPQTPQYRTEKSRIVLGERACDLRIQDEKNFDHIYGIRGMPVLYNMKHFDATWSGTPDALHVIFEGIGKFLVQRMIEDSTKNDYVFPRSTTALYVGVDAMKDELIRVSELRRIPPSFRKLSNWKALDYHTFYTSLVGSLISCKTLIKNDYYRNCLVYLANVVYYLHHGKVDEDTKVYEKLKENVELFATEAKKLDESVLNGAVCTWKFHVLQHFPRLLKLHGPGYLWDSFNLETFLGILGKLITTRRNQDNQAVTAYCLKYHADVFNAIAKFQPRVREFLAKQGLDTEDLQFVKLGTFTIEYGLLGSVDEDVLDMFKENLVNEFRITGNDYSLRRPVRMRRRNQVITSAAFKHKGQINDSYLMIDCKVMGRVLEIFQVDESFFFVLQVFKEDELFEDDDCGARVLFPDNQIPVIVSEEKIVIKLKQKTFLQKIMLTKVLHQGVSYPMFIIRPNDFFSGA